MNNIIKPLKKFIISKKYIIISIIIIIYFMYIYYYYRDINFDTFTKHTVGSLNLLAREIKQLIITIMKNTKSVTTISFMASLFIIIKFTNINKLILSIKSMQVDNYIKIEVDPIKELISKDGTEDVDTEVRNKILNVLIDNPEIIELVEAFINNATAIDIPLNRVPLRYKINCIDFLFEKEFHPNSIRIKSIKESIKKDLVSVYRELSEKGLIYTELNT